MMAYYLERGIPLSELQSLSESERLFMIASMRVSIEEVEQYGKQSN